MTTTSAQGWVVLKVDGDVDLARRQELEDLVAAKDDRYSNLVFDLSDVTFMDSTGLGWLLRSQDLLADRGGQCVVVLPTTLDRLFSAAGITDQFEIHRSVEEATHPRT